MLLLAAARGWLHEILVFPHDPNRADMLVVIQFGIRRLLQGGDPYAMYNVPWPATLPYGPVMWAPMILPTLAHADVRFVTLFGFVFAAMTCCAAVLSRGGSRRASGAVAWLIVLAAVAFSQDLRHFVSIGHTPAYWPLLGLFAFLVVREQWEAAAVTAGLLIVARTTMIAVAPVVLIAVWYRARPTIVRVTALMTAAVVIPFLPFAIWNWSRAGSTALRQLHQCSVVKAATWCGRPSNGRSGTLIGITGPLLALGWRNGAVEIVQIAVMVAVYALIAAVAILRAGRRPRAVDGVGAVRVQHDHALASHLSVFRCLPAADLRGGRCRRSFCRCNCQRRRHRPVGSPSLAISCHVHAVASVAFTAATTVPIDSDRRCAARAITALDRSFIPAFPATSTAGRLLNAIAWVDGTRAEIVVADSAAIAQPRDARSSSTLSASRTCRGLAPCSR